MIWKWQVVKDYLARLGTMSCIYDMQWFMKKSLENRLGIAVRFEKKTISSIVRNFPNRSRENAKFRILKVTIITPNCQLFCWGHPSKLGDIYLPGTFWESPWITLCLRQLQGIKTFNSYVSLCSPKESIQHFSRGSQLPPSTPWSIFL